MLKRFFASLALVVAPLAMGAPASAESLEPSEALADKTLCHPTAIDNSAPASIASLRKNYENEDWIEDASKRYPDLLDTVMEATNGKMRQLMQQNRAACVKAIGEVFDSRMKGSQIAAALAYLDSESGQLHRDFLLKETPYREIIEQAERAFRDKITEAEAIEAYELNMAVASYAVFSEVGPEKGAPMVAYVQSNDGMAFTKALGKAVEPWRQWTGRVVRLNEDALVKAGADAGKDVICSDTTLNNTSHARRRFCSEY